jgi:chemotaxis protein MotB
LALIGILLAPGCASRRQVEMLQGQLDLTMTENEKLKNSNRALQSKLDDLLAETAGLRERLAGAEDEAEEARRKAADLQKNLSKYGFKVSRRGGEIVVTLPQKILFRPGSASIRREAGRGLMAVAEALKAEFPKEIVRVEGHTDTDPIKTSGWEDNWHLSSARARAVLRVLLKEGIEPERMYFAGFSFYKPVADPDTKTGKTKNRRVEVVILPAGGS